MGTKIRSKFYLPAKASRALENKVYDTVIEACENQSVTLTHENWILEVSIELGGSRREIVTRAYLKRKDLGGRTMMMECEGTPRGFFIRAVARAMEGI